MISQSKKTQSSFIKGHLIDYQIHIVESDDTNYREDIPLYSKTEGSDVYHALAGIVLTLKRLETRTWSKLSTLLIMVMKDHLRLGWNANNVCVSRTSNVMDELSKFVNYVRNLDNEGITEATFDVKFLVRLFERVYPTLETKKQIKAEQNIVGDGGKFLDGD